MSSNVKEKGRQRYINLWILEYSLFFYKMCIDNGIVRKFFTIVGGAMFEWLLNKFDN